MGLHYGLIEMMNFIKRILGNTKNSRNQNQMAEKTLFINAIWSNLFSGR